MPSASPRASCQACASQAPGGADTPAGGRVPRPPPGPSPRKPGWFALGRGAPPRRPPRGSRHGSSLGALLLSTRGGKGPPPPSLAPHSAHPGRPTRSASPSPRGCRGQGLCLDLSLGLWVSQPPGRAPAGTQRGPRGGQRDACPLAAGPPGADPSPRLPLKARSHQGRPGVWTPHPVWAGLRSAGLGCKRSALCAFEGEGDGVGRVQVPGPCAVFRSVSEPRSPV